MDYKVELYTVAYDEDSEEMIEHYEETLTWTMFHMTQHQSLKHILADLLVDYTESWDVAKVFTDDSDKPIAELTHDDRYKYFDEMEGDRI